MSIKVRSPGSVDTSCTFICAFFFLLPTAGSNASPVAAGRWPAMPKRSSTEVMIVLTPFIFFELELKCEETGENIACIFCSAKK